MVTGDKGRIHKRLSLIIKTCISHSSHLYFRPLWLDLRQDQAELYNHSHYIFNLMSLFVLVEFNNMGFLPNSPQLNT